MVYLYNMPMAFIIVGVILTAAYTCLMVWYWQGWKRTGFILEPNEHETKVSIIIAARNEEKNIVASLDSIRVLQYPPELLEVIVVDDHSTDNTAVLARGFGKVTVITQDQGIEGKKKAIEKAIKIATGTLIITTDADCVVGRDWLEAIVEYYELYKPKMIAGPVYFGAPKGVLGIWQALDFAGLMAITAASIKNGLPQMCNGANLAYEKEAFYAVNGFEGIDAVPTGDDQLLMIKMQRQFPGEIHFMKAPEAIVHTLPQPDFSSLVSQRLRWVSKSKVFPDWRITAILVLAYFFNLLIALVFVAGIYLGIGYWPGLLLFTFKMLLELPLLYGSLKLSRQRQYLWQLPWVAVLHLLYVIAIGPLSLFGRYQWKGRGY